MVLMASSRKYNERLDHEIVPSFLYEWEAGARLKFLVITPVV